MKIVMFSINPIFPKVVTGGASKHLYLIARHLGMEGHAVEVICAQTGDGQAPFTWAENVTVSPILPFSLPFPQPYAVSGGDLTLIVQRMADALKNADRFYVHDGEFLLPDVYSTIPTVASFRDNIYPESVLGSFIGKFDEVICVSDYSASVIEATAGRFYPDLGRRLHRVNNGVDLEVFKPVATEAFAARLGVHPGDDFIILHPHRPELGKGLPETVQVVHRLVNQHGMTNLKVLIPEWIGSMVSSGESQFYNEMMHLMADLGVSDYFKFIPWLTLDQMPTLYSLGDVTLCLGNIVEAFGNVAYESLACGTPSIVAKVGVHRTLLPDALIAKVDFGDIQAAVEIVLEVAAGHRMGTGLVLDHLREHFNFEHQLRAYADIIIGCEKRPTLPFVRPETQTDQPFELAPWCYLAGGQVYHDFRGRFEPAGELTGLFKNQQTVSMAAALKAGFSPDLWDCWMDKTYLVPTNPDK